MDGKGILLKMARENYSWEVIQDMIDREVSAAFKIRIPPEMPSKKEIKRLNRPKKNTYLFIGIASILC